MKKLVSEASRLIALTVKMNRKDKSETHFRRRKQQFRDSLDIKITRRNESDHSKVPET